MQKQMEEKDAIIEQLKTDNAQLHSVVDDLAYRLETLNNKCVKTILK